MATAMKAEVTMGATEAPNRFDVMKVDVICSEAVIPSSPTPPHLKSYALSLCDQLNPAVYVPVILYYPNEEDLRTTTASADKIQRLKSSLSVLLARFYPFAGRIKDNLSIECNDEGAMFVEAKVDRELSEVLACPDPRELRMLLPVELESAEASRVYPFLVQANLFHCGGLALAMCISHKIADATTMSNFIKSWANVAVDLERLTENNPQLDASTIFHPLSHLHDLPVVDFPKDKRVTRRYSFDSSKIATLVELAKSEWVVQPTRVEAVSALLWWCVTRASRRQRSVLVQAVNLRPRMSPPIADSKAGNIATVFATEMNEDVKGESSGLIRKLTAKLREEKDEFLENVVKRKMVGETVSACLLETFEKVGGMMKNQEVDMYICSSWYRLSMYESDFGWGNPIWLSLVKWHFSNTMILMEGRGGDEIGMEVWLTLQEDHMAVLDLDQELLRFATLNPAISLGDGRYHDCP